MIEILTNSMAKITDITGGMFFVPLPFTAISKSIKLSIIIKKNNDAIDSLGYAQFFPYTDKNNNNYYTFDHYNRRIILNKCPIDLEIQKQLVEKIKSELKAQHLATLDKQFESIPNNAFYICIEIPDGPYYTWFVA